VVHAFAHVPLVPLQTLARDGVVLDRHVAPGSPAQSLSDVHAVVHCVHRHSSAPHSPSEEHGPSQFVLLSVPPPPSHAPRYVATSKKSPASRVQRVRSTIREVISAPASN
jgi:hypothetical protein